MFKLFSNESRLNWYPGARVMRDRWGTPINTAMGAREFRPVADQPESVVNHMRWSLGLM